MKQNYPPEGFYKRLREAIANSGLKMSEIRRKVNISDSCLYSYVNGVTLPSVTTLANLCRVLNVSADYLLFGRSK